jgi:hypothetical protein
MNRLEISELLSRFYEGDTSEDEERLLRLIFSGDSIPEGFEAERDYILFCLDNAGIPAPSADFEERITRAVSKSEQPAKQSEIKRRLLVVLTSAAAVIMIITGSYFFLASRNTITDTYSDPEVAYAETMKILLEVSAKLNKGTQALKPVGKLNTVAALSVEKVNNSSELINKSFQKLKNLDKGTSLFNTTDSGKNKIHKQ